MKTPYEAMIIIQCSRCDAGGIGRFVREGDAVHTLGFAFPMGVDEQGEPLSKHFKEDEVVLCQRCMNGDGGGGGDPVEASPPPGLRLVTEAS